MNQYICLLTFSFNELEGRIENMDNLLGGIVIQIKFEILNFLRILEPEVNARTYPKDLIITKLLKVMGEVVPANPNLS